MNLTYQIKSALLHYLRFKKQCFVATEVSLHLGNADILYIPKTKTDIYEIEIKISKTDFLKEWNKKEFKHKCLNSSYINNLNNPQINYFSFCVPEELKDFALEQIKDKPYGLFIFKEVWKHKNKLQEQLDLSECITCVKSPKRLLQEKSRYFDDIKERICLRAMSDLAMLYKLYYYNGDKKTREIVRDKIV